MAVYPLRPGHPFKELAQTRAWVKHFNMATGLPACSRPGGSLLLSSCVRIAFYLIPKMPLPFVLFMIDFVSLLNFKTKTFKHENVFPWSWGQGGLNLYMLPQIPKKKKLWEVESLIVWEWAKESWRQGPLSTFVLTFVYPSRPSLSQSQLSPL